QVVLSSHPFVIFRPLPDRRQLSILSPPSALGEDALQQLGCRLVGPALGAGQLGLGRDQAALDGRVKDRRAIPLQIALDAFERSLGFVEPREMRINRAYDSALLGNRW